MRESENRRESNRTYPPETKHIFINEKLFILNNIGRNGISVLVETTSDFSLGQRIVSILLENHADAPSLAGVVSHMSQSESDIVCGIRFEFQNRAEFDYVEKIKDSLAVR